MDSGFQKIYLENNAPVFKTQKRSVYKLFRLAGTIIGLLFILIFVFLAATFFLGKDVYFSAQKTAQIASESYTFLKNQDIEGAKLKLNDLQNSLSNLKDELAKFTFISYLPFIGVYVTDGQHLVNASIAGVEGLQITINTLIPYSDLLGLKGKSTFVAGTADERIAKAVETLDKIIPNVDQITDKISIAKKELFAVNYQRYPEKIGNIEVRNKLKTAQDLFGSTASLFIDAQPLLKQIPNMLGTSEPRKYLVIFQNDAELRSTGGFITAYAIFKTDKGKLTVEEASDIYKLDSQKKKKYDAPPPILKYHKNVNFLELRDNNLSPDFLVSMTDFEKMLLDAVPDFPKFDGIIALDTHVLVSTVNILGDFNIYGRNFSGEIDKRCNCPKVIYELEDYATRPVAYVRADRKDILGVLLYQIMQRALGVSPSKYWGQLSQMFLKELKEKHILFYLHDPQAQKGLEALNFAGRIVSSDGDYLHVNNVNFAGAKSNLFVENSVKNNLTIENDQSVTKEVTLTYRNPAPASNCNLEAGELCLNGILRNWLRVYVPKGSKLKEFTGSETDTLTYDELEKTVFEGFFTVKPQGKTELKITYSLPFKLQDGIYKILIQKQPGTDNNEYSLSKNNKEYEKLKLVTDKESVLKN